MTGFSVAVIAASVLIAFGLLAAWLARRQVQQARKLIRHKIVDGQSYKVIGRIQTDEILYALIPAITQIEGGFYENVSAFIENANAELEKIGSPFRYRSTSKSGNHVSVGIAGEYVDSITVVEVSQQIDEGAVEAFIKHVQKKGKND